MLVLSTRELDLDGAKELKGKIKTMTDLQKLLEQDHVALALVKDGLESSARK